MIQRFSVSLDPTLLAQFDGYIRTRSYENRSEAVRDLIRDALHRHDSESGQEIFGVISLAFDHSIPQLQNRITAAQHAFHAQIVSTTHVHIDHDNCLEVIVVRGNVAEVSKLSNQLSALRGVRNCSMSTAGTRNPSANTPSTHTHHESS